MLVSSAVEIKNELFDRSAWFASTVTGDRSGCRARHVWLMTVGPVIMRGTVVMRDFPVMSDSRGSVEPVPRRLRGFLGGEQVFDSTRGVYVWDSPKYPAYYVPLADLDARLLVDDDHSRRLRRGSTRTFSLRAGDVVRPASVIVYDEDADPGVAGLARVEWAALDAWFEEDEQVFVHPRNPYTRVDALRSSRTVRVELAGQLLAESAATVMVFETGLPTRYYFDRLSVDFSVLVASDTVTECPYKGRTTGYWSARVAVDLGEAVVDDVAWSYDFPTRALTPIAGLVAFYNEHTTITVDGEPASSAGETRPVPR